MNVIIVAGFLKSPLKLQLRDPRFLLLASIGLIFVLSCGATMGWFLRASDTLMLQQVELAQQAIQQQQSQLTEVRAKAEQDLNALAAKLGQLQAHANRLNALGERLTEIGKLNDGEFDFGSAPGLGGPEALDTVSDTQQHDLTDSLEALALQFAAQEQQLDVLEQVLLDRDLEAALMPTGSPVRAGYASSTYGMRIDPFTGRSHFHAGVDYNGPRGTEILAVADGVVRFAGRSAGYGNTVEIDHGNGYVTRYAHNQENLAAEGARVRAGDVIAKMGSSGRSTGSHVHIEVLHNGRAVNPVPFLRKARQG
ncbi:MAG TPA: M23 family metallopeptidase [Aquimonas sp.]|nr:M23 family metallopeptidase [Aquimonas sp.]HRF54148.1 M23 family metallopeptidase [Aquimonas sp.]